MNKQSAIGVIWCALLALSTAGYSQEVPPETSSESTEPNGDFEIGNEGGDSRIEAKAIDVTADRLFREVYADLERPEQGRIDGEREMLGRFNVNPATGEWSYEVPSSGNRAFDLRVNFGSDGQVNFSSSGIVGYGNPGSPIDELKELLKQFGIQIGTILGGLIVGGKIGDFFIPGVGDKILGVLQVHLTPSEIACGAGETCSRGGETFLVPDEP